MEIKKTGSPKSVISLFDLLGNDETALSKAFAFVLGKEKDALKDFLKFIGISKRITDKYELQLNIQEMKEEQILKLKLAMKLI